MTDAINVIVIFEAKPGNVSEVQIILTGLIAPSRAEDTCMEYRLHQDIDKPEQFIFYEKWQNRNALDAHLEMPYISDAAEKIESFLVGTFQVIFTKEL